MKKETNTVNNPLEIEFNQVKYIRKDAIQQNTLAKTVKGLQFVIIRTYSAGVHFGYLKKAQDKRVELVNSRRVWQWAGACSLSQMAVDGIQNSTASKISVELQSIILTEVIEIIPTTQKAKDNLQNQPIWKK